MQPSFLLAATQHDGLPELRLARPLRDGDLRFRGIGTGCDVSFVRLWTIIVRVSLYFCLIMT